MRTHCTFLILTTVGFCSVIAFSTPYSGGDGSAEAPYRISTAADWIELTRRPGTWDKQFILTADIDLAGIELSPVAPHANPDMEFFEGTVFSGCFDGQGYTVSNVVIDRPDMNFIALFGCVGNGGRIQNLRVDNVQMTGRRYVAGLVAGNGHAPYDPISGTISNCHVTGVVVGQHLSGRKLD